MSEQRLTPRLNWLWRLLATALCFTLFGCGALLLSLLWFRLLSLVVREPVTRRRIARRSIASSFRCFLWICRAVRVLDYHIDGKARLTADSGCLVVANHPTLIDYMLLVSVMPDTDCLVKSALRRNPFVSGIIRAADYLLNSEADSLLPLCQARLAAGDTILIFPEGTRTVPGVQSVLQRGAANIAVRCRCDLRVVVIRCSEPFLGKTSHWYDIPAHKPQFHITVGERLKISEYSDNTPPSLAARQLNRRLSRLLLAEQ